ALATWEQRQDEKQRDEDKREPMKRMYAMVIELDLFTDCSEEQIIMRLVGYFAGIGAVPAEPRAAAPRTPPERFHDPIPPAPGGGHPSAPRAAPRRELPRAASGPAPRAPAPRAALSPRRPVMSRAHSRSQRCSFSSMSRASRRTGFSGTTAYSAKKSGSGVSALTGNIQLVVGIRLCTSSDST